MLTRARGYQIVLGLRNRLAPRVSDTWGVGFIYSIPLQISGIGWHDRVS